MAVYLTSFGDIDIAYDLNPSEFQTLPTEDGDCRKRQHKTFLVADVRKRKGSTYSKRRLERLVHLINVKGVRVKLVGRRLLFDTARLTIVTDEDMFMLICSCADAYAQVLQDRARVEAKQIKQKEKRERRRRQKDQTVSRRASRTRIFEQRELAARYGASTR